MTELGAVVFDLDGVLVDSEQVWDTARRQLVAEVGGRWRNEATRAMMGMSSTEWSAYMHEELSVPLSPSDIDGAVVQRMMGTYRERLPLIPGAQAAVERMAERWPLGLASSSNRELINLVLDLSGIRDRFATTVSSEEVARGKPAPHVYLEVANRLSVPPQSAVAIEDSTNGIRSARAAGMAVIAIPNRALPPDPDVLPTADLVLESLSDLSVSVVENLSPH
jgi:HAD superfamily hydrolase (TIGR01509 family)